MPDKPETTCREYLNEYVREVERSRFSNLHLGIHMKFTALMNKIVTELEQLKEDFKSWINKSEKSKRPLRKTPEKKKKSLKVSKKPTKKETKYATTAKKCSKKSTKKRNKEPEWKVKITRNRNANNKLQRHK